MILLIISKCYIMLMHLNLNERVEIFLWKKSRFRLCQDWIPEFRFPAAVITFQNSTIPSNLGHELNSFVNFVYIFYFNRK